MKVQSQAQIGAACVSVFILGSVFLVLLIAFGIATAAGLALALAKGERFAFVTRAPGDVVLMNLATAGAWFCYFLALKWLDPSIVNTLFAGIGPFAIIALNACGFSITVPESSTTVQKALQVGVVGSLCALIGIAVLGESGLHRANPALSLAGAGLALLAGCLISIGHLYARRLNDRGVSPDAIMATRFIALLTLAAVLITYEQSAAGVLVPVPVLARIAAAAGLLIVLPVYFNQIGMALISPLAARVMTAAGPVLVFVLQQFDPRIGWSTATFATVLAYSGFVIAANLVQGKVWRVRRIVPASRPYAAGMDRA